MGCTPSLLPERDARGPLRIYARSRGTGTYIDRLVARLGWCFVHHGRAIPTRDRVVVGADRCALCSCGTGSVASS
jgi:hypothetical protein